MLQITATGRVSKPPRSLVPKSEERAAKVRFTMAVNHFASSGNNQLGAREQVGSTWLTVLVFGQLAENCQESLTKGTLVTVTGPAETRTYTTEDGESSDFRLRASDVAISLRDGAISLEDV